MSQPAALPEEQPELHVIDSSGWLEYLADGPNADWFAPSIENTAGLVVPSLSILEVAKWVMRERGETQALEAVALMLQGRVVALDGALALNAAKLGLQYRLPLADSVMLATAYSFEAILWTQDAHFRDLPGVRYRAQPTNDPAPSPG